MLNLTKRHLPSCYSLLFFLQLWFIVIKKNHWILFSILNCSSYDIAFCFYVYIQNLPNVNKTHLYHWFELFSEFLIFIWGASHKRIFEYTNKMWDSQDYVCISLFFLFVWLVNSIPWDWRSNSRTGYSFE